MWLALAILSFALRVVGYFGGWLYVVDLVVSNSESFCDRKSFHRRGGGKGRGEEAKIGGRTGDENGR
jgi:hypothetical protein